METELAKIAHHLARLDRSVIKHWLKRGELLLAARQLLGEDATFARWCKQQKIPKTTAYKAMRASRDFGQVPRSAQFSKEAMAILSQSPAARTIAIEQSKKERITARIARLLVDAELPQVSIPLRRKPLSVPIQVPGGFVVIKADKELSQGDLLGMLAFAARELKKIMLDQDAA